MITKFKSALLAAGIALSAGSMIAAAPASAQVNGIATTEPAVVIARAAARTAAYNQINTTYSAQLTQLTQYRQEMQTLQQSLDTDKDNQLSQAEIDANPTVVQQIQAKEQQIQQASQPIVMAQYFVIEQILGELVNARTQVISSKGIQLMIAPDAIQYAPPQIDVTSDIVAALDQRLPTVSTTVPANWQPRQSTVQMQQAVQQVLVLAAQQQAAQQAAQQQGAAGGNVEGR